MSKIVFVKAHQIAPTIKQSRLKRDWMDDTYNKHAYRCLPVSTANVNGWEVVLQQDIVVKWDGGNAVPKIISGDNYSETKNGVTYDRLIANCNKIGMIDISFGWAFKTDPDYNVLITGSPNYFIEGAVPLTASIPSDWWPDPVDISWKLTKVNEEVTFPAGMPFAFITVYPRNLMPEMEVEVEYLWDKPKLIEERTAYSDAKMRRNIEKPWTWMNGMRTGLNEKGERIGPRHEHLPVLREPDCR